MRDWFQRILDPNGNQSTTRLVLIWLVLNATFMGWYIICFGTEHASESTLVMGAVTAIAGILKYAQKGQEKDGK